jgi:hypothetical protein
MHQSAHSPELISGPYKATRQAQGKALNERFISVHFQPLKPGLPG